MYCIDDNSISYKKAIMEAALKMHNEIEESWFVDYFGINKSKAVKQGRIRLSVQ